MKPYIKRITLSRQRIRWCILIGNKILGFKKQTQFKSFACACFLASCVIGREEAIADGTQSPVVGGSVGRRP
jgi:hypothetical protein